MFQSVGKVKRKLYPRLLSLNSRGRDEGHFTLFLLTLVLYNCWFVLIYSARDFVRSKYIFSKERNFFFLLLKLLFIFTADFSLLNWLKYLCQWYESQVGQLDLDMAQDYETSKEKQFRNHRSTLRFTQTLSKLPYQPSNSKPLFVCCCFIFLLLLHFKVFQLKKNTHNNIDGIKQKKPVCFPQLKMLVVFKLEDIRKPKHILTYFWYEN